MGKLPKMVYTDSTNTADISTFGGLDLTEAASGGKYIEAINMSLDAYPALSPRKGRTLHGTYTSPTGLFSWDGGLVAVDGNTLYYNGEAIGSVSEGEKQFAVVNTKLCIFPDKKYIDLTTSTFKDLGANLVLSPSNLYIVVGETQDSLYYLNTFPISFSDYFKAGDRIDITGFTNTPYNREKVMIVGVTSNGLTFPGNTFLTGTPSSNLPTLTLSRKIPDLEFICESNNRLWGVSNTESSRIYDTETSKYKDITSRVLWASALGDPTNFYSYAGISTDSYAVAVASKNDFTAIKDYSGGVLFFKEDKLYKISGGYPAEYYMYDYDVPGVQSGSHKSLQIINEVLFYKGVDGVNAYTGGQPSLISYKLGNMLYSGAVSGSDGRRYYLSMKDSDGTWGLFVYDTVVGEWVKEGNEEVKDATFLDDVLYLLIGTEVYAVGGSSAEVEWAVQFADFDEGTMKRKRYKWLRLRGESEAGAAVTVKIAANGISDKTVLIFTAETEGKWRKNIPLPPMRTDYLTVKLSGTGMSVITDLSREFTVGDEVN